MQNLSQNSSLGEGPNIPQSPISRTFPKIPALGRGQISPKALYPEPFPKYQPRREAKNPKSAISTNFSYSVKYTTYFEGGQNIEIGGNLGNSDSGRCTYKTGIQ
jgi:hypothetical protein